jgi:putative FmdB family regulatory protein
MASYDYECTNDKCKYQFTVEQSMNEEHTALCKKCGCKAKRLYTPIISVFKCGGNFGKSK